MPYNVPYQQNECTKQKESCKNDKEESVMLESILSCYRSISLKKKRVYILQHQKYINISISKQEEEKLG